MGSYHLQAAIAYWHTVKDKDAEKWHHILQLYDFLLQVEYSPVAALNRLYALSKVKGNIIAIQEAEKLDLTGNHYYHTLLGVLYSDTDDTKSKFFFEQALLLARTGFDRETIQQYLIFSMKNEE